jgi:hypothetical protein
MSESTSAFPVAAPGASAFIHTSRLRLGGALACITFPAPASLPRLALHRNLQFALLLQLANGAVWFLRSPAPWIDERIQAVARALLDQTAPDLLRPELEMRMAYALDLPSLVVADPPLGDVDGDAWGVRLTATAAMLKIDRGAGTRQLADVLSEIESALRQQLRKAAGEFVAGLDAEALELASRQTGFDVGIYNYLADTTCNNNGYRKQFAHNFPLLVRAAALAYPGGEASGLRQAVDNGLPIIRYLSRSLGVSASCVRSLARVGPALAGQHWQERHGILLRLLDALCPEHRPGRDPQAWADFDAAIRLAERRFRRKAHTSPLAMAWLQAAAKGGWAELKHDVESRTEPGIVAAVDLLRNAAVRMFSEQVSKGSKSPVNSVPVITQTVDRHLLGYGSRRLTELARAFEAAVARERNEQADKMHVLDGAFWPFLPSERLYGGRRRIRALASREDLRRHGLALGICLGSSYLDAYAASCARGEAYLVGLFDMVSNAPKSTARFRLLRDIRDGRFRPELMEFTGRENASPSEDCRRALIELIGSAGDAALQQHWNKGFRLMEETQRHGRDAAKERMERLILERGLREALGASYDRLQAEVQRALSEPLAAR